MVRHQANKLFDGFEPETKPRGRHSISHPPDNIGIACTVQRTDSEERILQGRRRVLVVPRDNIGIACLPTPDRLDNIVELPEHESSDDEFVKELDRKPPPKIRTRGRLNSTKDEIFGAGQSTTSSDESKRMNTNDNSRFERSRSCKRHDTVGLLWQETGEEVHKKFDVSKKVYHASQGQIGISNVRRPKDDPTKPRKPILPRDNIGFACKPLHKSALRSKGSRLSTGANHKNVSSPGEKKNILHSRSAAESPEENANSDKTTKEQIDTLRTSETKTDVH